MGDKKEDASRKILFLLLLIILFVSILGTWITLSIIDQRTGFGLTPRVVEIKQTKPATTSGYLALQIIPPQQPTPDREKGDY